MLNMLKIHKESLTLFTPSSKFIKMFLPIYCIRKRKLKTNKPKTYKIQYEKNERDALSIELEHILSIHCYKKGVF